MKRSLLNQPIFRLIVPPIYGTMMYFLILLINNNLGQLTETMFNRELLVCVVLAYLVSEPIRLVILLFLKKYQDELRKPTNIGFLLVTNLIIGSLIIFLAAYSYFRFIEGANYLSTFQTPLINLTVVFGVSALLYSLFFLSLFLLTIKNESELKKEDLKRQNLEHQLEIFNNEINPDLLFQSLETLISLVHHNLDSAEDFVDRLALVYRYILDNRKKELVSVDDEIRASKNLIYLFKEKFPDQLNYELKNENKARGKMLVPNTLSMVLDCLINGSIISPWQPLNITVDFGTEDGYMVVQHKENDKLSNNKYIKNQYQNLHEAFSFFTDQPVIQIKAYGDAFIKIPLLDLN